MEKELIVKKTVELKAPATKVWDALTNAALTPKYMYGSSVVSDWQQGSPVLWIDRENGKEEIFLKGNVTGITPGSYVAYTIFAPGMGYPDIPENYITITYTLEEANGACLLTVTQGDYAQVPDSEKRYKESHEAWDVVLPQLKQLVEQA